MKDAEYENEVWIPDNAHSLPPPPPLEAAEYKHNNSILENSPPQRPPPPLEATKYTNEFPAKY